METGQRIWNLIQEINRSGNTPLRREILSDPDSVFRHLVLALYATSRQLGVQDGPTVLGLMIEGASFAGAVTHCLDNGR